MLKTGANVVCNINAATFTIELKYILQYYNITIFTCITCITCKYTSASLQPLPLSGVGVGVCVVQHIYMYIYIFYMAGIHLRKRLLIR